MVKGGSILRQILFVLPLMVLLGCGNSGSEQVTPLHISDAQLREVFGSHQLLGGNSPTIELSIGTGVHEGKIFASVFMIDLNIAEWTLVDNEITKVVYLIRPDEPYIMELQLDYLEKLFELMLPGSDTETLSWFFGTLDTLQQQEGPRSSSFTYARNMKITAELWHRNNTGGCHIHSKVKSTQRKYPLYEQQGLCSKVYDYAHR